MELETKTPMSMIDQTIENNKRFSEGGIEASIKYIQRDIAEIKDGLNNKYVTKDEFDPVKRIAYGVVTLILTAVILAILYLVLRRPPTPLT